MNLAELLTIPASMFPEQEIVRFEGAGWTYAELQERVGRMAGALRQLGVGPDDRVGLLETNTPWVLAALYAAASLGAVAVPLSYRARQTEITAMLGLISPRVVLAGQRYLELSPGAIALDELESRALEAELVEPVEVAEDEVAVMLFTSGTTAAAKAVMLAHADLTSYVFNTTDAADGSDVGAVLLAAPFYHVAGLTAALAATFAGRRLVMQRQFVAEEWLRLVETERVTHAFLVPTMLKQVLDQPGFAQTDLSTLQVVSYGAAPMPLSVIRRAIEAFPPGVNFFNAFGQTETTSTVTMLGPEDHRLDGPPEEVERKLRRLRSIGRPLADVEVQILDETGQACPPGQVGEIAIRTERLMRGYYGQAHTPLQDGWLRTRDLGWVDEDGYVYLAGRASDLIIRGGENIAPDEVEQVLVSHPAVDEAAVVGVPDEEWGERVAAVVVRRPDAPAPVTADELIEYARQRLASFKKPERIVFADSLPRGPLGKLLRNEVRGALTSSGNAREREVSSGEHDG
jgi:acyl-CoA synthetase (AMP-forming)/AMP-acid ligase II